MVTDFKSASPRSWLQLDPHGAQCFPAALADADIASLRAFADDVLKGRSGVRVFGDELSACVLEADGGVGRHALPRLGAAAQPVRAIVFDKTAENNWAVAWHQDRTVAVRARLPVPGFGPWSKKSGVIHVEPPFDVISGMLTVRAHLDDCAEHNAPLLIAPGSHRLGRILASECAAVAQQLGQVSCPACTGDVWLYATSIIHASERARKPCRRRVLQVDYASTRLPGGLEWLGVTN